MGILSGGRIVYVKGYASVHTNGNEELASVSKSLTALLAMKLVEEGKLELDAPVTRYLGDLDLPSEVTPRSLLTHTSGLPHYSGPFAGGRLKRSDFRRANLAQPPGRGYLYSSPGYFLLSLVLQEAGGAPFLDLLNAKILRPAGAGKAELDRTYAARLGAGGLAMSTEALTRVAYALLQRRLLKRESYREMWSVQARIPDKSFDQGLGFRVDGKGRVHHGGSHPRTNTYQRLVLYPQRGHGMVLLVRAGGRFQPGKLSTALYKAMKSAGHRF